MLTESGFPYPVPLAKHLIRIATLIFASGWVAAAVADPIPAYPSGISASAQSRTLYAVLKDITKDSGVVFKLADGLGQERVATTLTGKTSTEAVKKLLQGYNYAVETGPDGAWKTVTISGKNGDGTDTPEPKQNQSTITKSAKAQRTSPLFKLPSAAVTPITLPLATLKGMKKGQKINLDLPSGPVSLLHDNRFNHRNGDFTWVGYVENEGQTSRAFITLGRSGPMGQLNTEEGTYQIVSENGQTYLVDISAAGLQPGSLQEDQALPTSPNNGAGGTAKRTAFANMASAPASPAPTDGQPKPVKIATLDLLVLYPKGMAQADTRINYLTALTNQAFLDSKANAQARVVFSQSVDYTETNQNDEALSDLTEAKGAFGKIPALREKYGADLVSLIRPFHATSQGSCGVAWVNGINGSAMSAEWAYSVVSDGYDQEGGLVYCGEHTLAHELGHNLGNVHDRPFSQASGVFPYSYAWGVEGVFGTIMSYHQPVLLLFASPLLGDACKGQACGYPEGDPNASDNVRTINRTAPDVAGFRPTTIP